MKYERITNRDTATVYKSDKFYNRLAELENAIEDGELVIFKRKPYEKLLPCKCGYNRREKWTSSSYANPGIYYRCIKCGYESFRYPTETKLRKGWNEEMRGLTK